MSFSSPWLDNIVTYAPHVGLIIGFCIFLYFAWMLLRQYLICLKNARMIEDTPTSKIRSAPQGYVELEGNAQFSKIYEQRAPLTYNDCCWYSFMVEELITQRVGNRTESRWEELITGQSPHLFLLVDDTGECVVAPIGAQVTTKNYKRWRSNKLPEQLDKNYKIGRAHV